MPLKDDEGEGDNKKNNKRTEKSNKRIMIIHINLILVQHNFMTSIFQQPNMLL